MIVGFAGIATFGVLNSNNTVVVDNQSFGILNSVESFTGGFNCACSDPDGIVPGFDMGFCNTDDNDPESLGTVGNQLCTWEINGDDYGDLLNTDEEGCTPKDWIKISKRGGSSWPAGYHKDMLFNDIFQTTLFKHNNNGVDNDDDDDRRGHDDDDDKDDREKDDKGKKHKDNDDKDDKSKKNKGKKNGELTLWQALEQKRGLLDPHAAKFAKEAVASLLNAAHYDINYYYSEIKIIHMTQDAVVNDDYKDITKEFKKYNKIGNNSVCPKR